MDIRQLRYFVAIVEAKSVSTAAQRVHVAQPSLSQHVRQMEAELGTTLLVRGPRGVVPTEAGLRLFRHAKQILNHFQTAVDEIRGSQVQPAGEVRFGISPTVAEVLSAPLVMELHRSFPLIRLCLVEAMSGYLLDWLREGRLDLATIYRQAEAQHVTCNHVLTEQLCLIGPAKVKLAEIAPGVVDFASIAKKPLIVPTSANGLRELIDEAAARDKIELNIRAEMDAYSQIKALCASGFGYSILPRVSLRGELESKRLQAWTIANPTIERSLYIAYPTNRPLSNAGVVVDRLCRQLIGQLVHSNKWPAELPPDAQKDPA